MTRWAVTGRDSLYVNTPCYRLYQNLTRLTEENVASKTLNRLKKAFAFSGRAIFART
jgi:hypothetical protein